MTTESKAFSAFSALIKEVDRIAIFIDGHATQNAARTLNMRIDWALVRSFFLDLARVRKMGFYLAVKEPLTQSQSIDDVPANVWWRSIVDWMTYNGYHTTVVRAFDCTMAEDGKSAIKTTIDLNLCIDAMSMLDEVDHIVLFSGNADFIPLITALQVKGKVVTVVSNSPYYLESLKIERDKNGVHPYQASKGLIRAADNLVELDSMRNEISSREKT